MAIKYAWCSLIIPLAKQNEIKVFRLKDKGRFSKCYLLRAKKQIFENFASKRHEVKDKNI